MEIRDLGEFGLIEKIREIIGLTPGLATGPGDDACAWRVDEGIQLATTDCLVEGTHFQASTLDWRDLGWKSLAINLSDIAAMGGLPRLALVALAMPEDRMIDDIIEIYRGIQELAQIFSVEIGGGNIARSPVFSITTTVIGSSQHDKLLLRSRARPGDTIAITGCPGSASAGRHLMDSGATGAAAANLAGTFKRPIPRVQEGRLLVENGVLAAIDISDGLMADLGHVLESSGVGGVLNIDTLPLGPLLDAGFSPEESARFALSGGEDYELLFTCQQALLESICRNFTAPVTPIGTIQSGTPGKIQLTGRLARKLKIENSGWQHFGK